MKDLKWFVEDESHERPGYICLAIRETESNRLIADMSDYPDDVPGFVERVKEEANIIASARELRDMLQKLVASAEPILLEFEAEAQKKCLGERNSIRSIESLRQAKADYLQKKRERRVFPSESLPQATRAAQLARMPIRHPKASHGNSQAGPRRPPEWEDAVLDQQ